MSFLGDFFFLVKDLFFSLRKYIAREMPEIRVAVT